MFSCKKADKQSVTQHGAQLLEYFFSYKVNLLLSGDCIWAEWASWSSCAESCSDRDGSGDQSREREIETQPTGNGAPCDPNDGKDAQSCSVECPSKISCIDKNRCQLDDYI